MLTPFTFEKDIPIHSIQPDGSPIYSDKINGHFIWDTDPNMCDPDCDCWMHTGDTSDEEEDCGKS